MMSTRGRVLMIRVVKKTIFLHVSKYDICNFFRTQSVPNSIGCEHDVSRLREERERERERVMMMCTCVLRVNGRKNPLHKENQNKKENRKEGDVRLMIITGRVKIKPFHIRS